MFNSIYIGYSGLLGFSKGLDMLSNNVSNMNTPGFKASELMFRDMIYRQVAGGSDNPSAHLQMGSGVDTPSSRLNFKQGDLRDTGNALDVAIDGNGFFVLRDGDQTFYTRNGQFSLDSNGILVDKLTGARVAGVTGGTLRDIDISGLHVNPARATSQINFINILNTGATTPHTVNNVTVIDSSGVQHTWSITFTLDNDVALNTTSPLLQTTDTVNSLNLQTGPLLTTHLRSLISAALTTVNTTSPTYNVNLINAALTTVNGISPTYTVNLNNAALTTVTTAAATYTIQPGDDWQIIANNIYGNPSAAGVLENFLGSPALTPGTDLIGLPASLDFYDVLAGQTWADIATALYGDANAATDLQTAMGNPALTPPLGLFNLPATLTPSGYQIQVGDTWQTIANNIYGTASAAGVLQNALGSPTLTPGNVLTGLPATLDFYDVLAGQTWADIATALYGDANAATTLQTAMGNPALTPPLGLFNLPATLTPSGYQIQVGDTWQTIANSVYGTASAAGALQNALGSPTLTPGNALTGLPATLNFYDVLAGQTWADIATALYGNADAATMLQTAMGNPALTPPLGLFNLPATLTVPAASPYYVVQAGQTWGDIATLLYNAPTANAAAVGADLAAALGIVGNPVAGTELTGFPNPLNLTTPVTIPAAQPYYVIQAGDTWDSIATALYGSPFGNELQAAFSTTNPTLVPGQRLTNPPTALTLSGSNRWAVNVLEGSNTVGTGEVRYAGSTNPIAGFQTVNIAYSPNGAATSNVTLDFSGSTSGSTSSSTLSVSNQNGVGPGAITDMTFDDSGNLTISYSNGQTAKPMQLALAWFEDLSALSQQGNAMFTAPDTVRPIIDAPRSGVMGKLAPKKVELSNVELTAEFTQMVIIQRGYQASSQVVSVSNEMIQQLMDLRSRR